MLNALSGEYPIDQRYPNWETTSHQATDFDVADTDGDGAPDSTDNCPSVSGPQTDSDGDGHGDICDNCPAIPNVLQTDSDADGIGDDCDNCPVSANTDQSDINANGLGDVCDPDADSDGKPNTTDCAPVSAATSDPAAEVTDLVFDPATSSLSWVYPPGVIPGELFRYVVARGNIADLQADREFAKTMCLGSALTGTSLEYTDLPPAGETCYYLVAAANACGSGTFGTMSDGTLRVITVCP